MTNETKEKTLTNQEGDKTPEENEKDLKDFTDEELEDLSREEIVEKLKEVSKSNKALSAQKKHYREKLEKSEVKPEKKEEEKEEETPSNLSSEVEQIKLVVNHRELDEEDVKEISAYAKGKGVSLEEAYKSPTMQAYIDVKKQKVAQETSTPSPSSRSLKFNDKEVSELSDKELQENFEEIMSKAAEAGRNKKRK